MSGKHECAYCHKMFVTISEHMIHVIKTHDRGFVPLDQRSGLRPATCWSCASDIWPNEDKRYVCTCGFDLSTTREQTTVD